jgi:hypothetical protein
MSTPGSTQLAMERAVLLAKADDMERQIKLQAALECAPALPVREPKVKAFAWVYGASELIAERKRVCEILALRAKVERVQPAEQHPFHCLFGMPVSFHEAFVGSDMERRSLMDRLHKLYDSQWQSDIVAVHLQSFPEVVPVLSAAFGRPGARPGESLEQRRAQWVDSMKHYYLCAAARLDEHRDSLLLMQSVCAELKPETRELLTRCTHFEQLDVSMLMLSAFPFEFVGQSRATF